MDSSDALINVWFIDLNAVVMSNMLTKSGKIEQNDNMD